MRAKSQVNRYYPDRSNYQSDKQFEEIRNLYDLVYGMHDKSHAMSDPPAEKGSKGSPGGPSNTKIGGLYVKGVPPAHASAPTYNKATGQFEYQTAGGSTVPATSSTAGVAGQIATDGTFIYICVATGSGTNTWKRASLSTF